MWRGHPARVKSWPRWPCHLKLRHRRSGPFPTLPEPSPPTLSHNGKIPSLFAGISELRSLFARNLAITMLPFNNLPAITKFQRNSFIFKQPSGPSFFSFSLPFVFNNSSGSSGIFNIFWVSALVRTSDFGLCTPLVTCQRVGWRSARSLPG
jgi:hypothetical protein